MTLSTMTTDYINIRSALKGNYRKGIHALREIIGTPVQAEELCANSGFLALVLSHDANHPDGNSEELRTILLESAYGDGAVENWLEILFPDQTAAQVIADDEKVKALVSGSNTSAAILESDKWCAQAICSLAGTSYASIDSISDMLASSTAMTAIYASSDATNAMLESSRVLKTVGEGNQTVQGNFFGSAPNSVVTKIMDDDGLFDTFKASAAFATKASSVFSSTFASESWATLAKVGIVAAANPSAFTSYQGKTRSVAITGEGTHNFEVAGVGMDGAGFTFVCDDLVGTHAMNSSSTTSGGWEGCAMRSWLSGTLINSFPSDLRAVIKTVTKKNTSGYGAATTQDKLWIPSYTEVGLQSGDAEGAKYPIFTDNASRIKKDGSSAARWWLRSVYSSSSFRYVVSDGSLGNYGASTAYGVCPCFCI